MKRGKKYSRKKYLREKKHTRGKKHSRKISKKSKVKTPKRGNIKLSKRRNRRISKKIGGMNLDAADERPEEVARLRTNLDQAVLLDDVAEVARLLAAGRYQINELKKQKQLICDQITHWQQEIEDFEDAHPKVVVDGDGAGFEEMDDDPLDVYAEELPSAQAKRGTVRSRKEEPDPAKMPVEAPGVHAEELPSAQAKRGRRGPAEPIW